MRPIVETDSPSYLLNRAQEFMRDADQADGHHEHCEAIKKAISLLALHLVKHDILYGHTPPGTRKAKPACKVTPCEGRLDGHNI